MFSSNWRQREQNGKDRLADQQEKRSDPTFQDRQAQLRQLAADQDAEIRAERQRLRLEREGPVRPVAELFRERFRDDLPEIVSVLSKRDGFAKLLPILKTMAAEDLQARKAAADAAKLEADKAKLVADGERRVKAMAEREAKRNAPAEIEGAEA